MNLYQYCMNNPVNFIDPYGLLKLRDGNYCGPDYSVGHEFPYTNPQGKIYKTVDDVPDAEWNQLQQQNSPKDCRDKAYQRHDNAYRDAGRKYGRTGKNAKKFKEAARAADRRLAEDLWKTGRTKDFVDDVFNGLYTILFKHK